MRELFYVARYRIVIALLLSGMVGFGIARYLYRGESPQVSRVPDYVVKLEKAGPSPARLSIAVGEMVQFNARDGSYHNLMQVATDNPKEYEHISDGYSSGVFAPDEAYQATFLKPGSYILHDHLHEHIFIYIDVHATTTGK